MRFSGTKSFFSIVLGLLVSVVPGVHAQAYDPIIESFRFTESDQLIIDRGGPVDRAGDVNGDGNEDLLIASGVGAVRVVFGPTKGFNGVVNGQQLDGVSGFAIVNDTEYDSLVAGLGDINGDGLDDIAVASRTGTRVIFGSTSTFSSLLNVATLNGRNGFVFDSAATDIKRVGDVNNDGLADFIIGNANASPNGLTGAGASYVIFGSTQTFNASLTPYDLDGTNGFSVIGKSAQDRTGAFVSGAGDFNNDGFDDFLIGAPNQTVDGKSEAGAAYLVFGASNLPMVFSLADINGGNGFVFQGSDIQDVAGAAVASVGDLNHDGVDDIAIGAPGKGPFGVPSSYAGETYVLFGGQFTGAARVYESDLNGSNGFVITGIRGGVIPIEVGETIWGDMAGADIDTLGDMNGDGIDDMIIGAPHTVINPSRKGVGQAYFLFGSSSAYPARFSLSDLDGSNGFRINGEGTTDYYSVSLASAGDFNNDDVPDAIIGASGQGETFVFYGRETSLVSVGDAPDAPVATTSTGFLAAVLELGNDAEPLLFDERRDPTGPNPLPPGTPTDPLNPATPGYTAPNPEYSGPVRRSWSDESSGIVEVQPEVPDNDNGSSTDNTGNNDDLTTNGDSAESIVRTSTGAMLWVSLLLLISVLVRSGSMRICRYQRNTPSL